MNIVLCEKAEKREFTAGNKARTDTVEILKMAGYKHIPLYTSKSKKVLIVVQIICGIFLSFVNLKKNDIVLIQYPYYPFGVNKILVGILSFGRHMKKYRIGILIHDSVSLRSMGNLSAFKRNIEQEIGIFDRTDFSIYHNKNMIRTFRSYGAKGKCIELGPFDYLYNGNMANREVQNSKVRIVVAGNLSRNKSGYLYNLKRNTSGYGFNLYGIGYTGNDDDYTKYMGQYPPEELIHHLAGQFGLVWDGESCETCSGDYGNYLKYNNPHKFSLYLAAGLPVIVWKESALSEYVEKNRIGICISSLSELDEKIKRIDNRKYKELIRNVERYRTELISGSHLLRCVHLQNEKHNEVSIFS